MRVAIDATPLTLGHAFRGIGYHTKKLIDSLKELQTERLRIDPVDFSKTDLSRYDVAHYTSFHPFFFSIPLRKQARKTILTIHDLIPLLYPNHYPPGAKGRIRFLLQKLLIKNIDAIITISETSKKDICRFLDVSPKKVFVVYLASGGKFGILDQGRRIFVKKKYNLPDKFVFYLGDVNYNKNIPNLITACEIARVPLVVCGKQAVEIDSLVNTPILLGPMDWIRYLLGRSHPEIEHLKQLSRKFYDSKDIFKTGFVSEEDLVAIFNLASVYVQPSFYEGFGFPVIHAMTSGCPVVASKTQALVEIGQDATLFADPNDPRDFAKKILQVCNNRKLKDELIKRGFARAKEFSWERTAGETLAVYQTVYEGTI